MTKFILALYAVLLILGTLSCRNPNISLSEREVAYGTELAKAVQSNLIYIRDSRTGFCFAYLIQNPLTSSAVGGLATVDCEKIPADLFVK